MEIVIKIDDKLYNRIKYLEPKADTMLDELMRSIQSGTPLPEQQPCEDCISRQAVLDIINFEDEWLFDAKSHNADTKIAFSAIKSKISEMPSVKPAYDLEEYSTKLWKLAYERGKAEQKWIPVSERLPEDYIHVLCQFYLGGMGECYLAHGAFHVVGGLVMTCNEVVAWMPLPQPYKAESEEEE